MTPDMNDNTVYFYLILVVALGLLSVYKYRKNGKEKNS
jgi:hypothetical protein